jgi:hypothetical protein
MMEAERQIVSGKELKQKIKGQPIQPEEWEIIKNEAKVSILFDGRRSFINCMREMVDIIPFSADSSIIHYIFLKSNSDIGTFLRMGVKHNGTPSIYFSEDGYGDGATYILKEESNNWYVNNIIPTDPD